jgi:predicted AlkP superfamily phosphohydrolase/phosphomutase
LRALHRSIDRTLQLGKFLLQRFPTLDLYVFVFMASDRVQHFYWNYVDRQYPDYVADAPQELKGAISAVYEHLDQAVGELTSGREDWNIMVMSDHGGGPFYRMVNLNRWLEREGYLRFLDASSATKDKQTVRLCYLRSAYRFFHQHIASALSHRQKDTLRKLVPQAVMSKLRGYRHNPMLSKIDWSRTQAYAQGAYGRIFLNIAGREPQGIVSFEKRKELLDEISAKLLTLRDPLADETVVEHVYRREELFQGPFVDHAPDLLIVWRGWRYHTKDTFANDVAIFSNPPYWRSGKLRHTGNHRIDGLLLIQGEMVNKHCEIKGAEIVDLAPTLLYLLGATIPDTMDGKVLIQAVEPGIRLRYPPRYGTLGEASRSEGEDYTDREEIAVRERLRGLGYVD